MNWLNDRGTPRFERKFFFTGNYRGHGGMDWPQTGVEPLEGTQSEGFSPINGECNVQCSTIGVERGSQRVIHRDIDESGRKCETKNVS